jgi:hypothetical protein
MFGVAQDGDGDRAVGNDVKTVASVALLENLSAGLEGFELSGPFQGMQFGREQLAEQLTGS